MVSKVLRLKLYLPKQKQTKNETFICFNSPLDNRYASSSEFFIIRSSPKTSPLI